jgi:hypothetical protein
MTRSAVSPVEFLDSDPNIPKELRPTLKLLFNSLDQLLFLDARGELSVDRTNFINLVSDPDQTPAKIRDVMLVETSKYLGQRIRSAKAGTRVNWVEGEKNGIPIHVPPLDELRSRGLDPSGSPEETQEAIRALYPDLPNFWVEPDPAVLSERIAVPT